MPSTVIHAAVGFALAAGLLGSYYDRRALAFFLAVLVLPEADALAGHVIDGAHRALLHNFVFTVAAVAVVAWDTTREASWIRSRFGRRGVRLAWAGLFVHTFAHMAFDWSHLDGINVFYPLVDRFFHLDGELYLSTADGFVQTFVEVGRDTTTGGQNIDVGQGGTTENTHVGSPAQPSKEPEPGPVDRRFPIAVRGWQLYLIAFGAFTLVAKRFQSPGPERLPEGDDA